MKKKRTDEGEGVCYYAKSEYQGQCQREPAGQLGDCHSSPAAQLDAVISDNRGHGDRKLIIMGTLETGVALIYLKLSYREPAEIGDLFQPFQNFVNTFFAGFLSTIFTFLWSLLFVIPGIVKALAYSQVYYILCDHPEYTGREAIDASQEMMPGA